MVRLLVLLALAGCTQPQRIAAPTPGVPMRVAPRSEHCDAWWFEPATYCKRGQVHDYDGCRWDCVPAPLDGARQ